MPALVWCNRRWLVGSDDFVAHGAVVTAVHTTCALLLLLVAYHGDLDTPSLCPGARPLLSAAAMLGTAVHFLGSLCFAALSALSSRGRVLQPSKRTLVPVALYACVVAWVLQAATDSYLVHAVFTADDAAHCNDATRRMLQAGSVLGVLLFVYVFFGFIFGVDPFGHVDVAGDPEAHESVWHTRCRVLCCCFTRGKEDDLFTGIAKAMAGVFSSHDIVLSDIATGMLLLHEHQRAVLRRRAQTVSYADNLPRGAALTSEARAVHPWTDADREEVRELQYYSRYYLAAYGHILYWYGHLFTGLPRLCAADCTMCCRDHPGRHDGDCCFCNNTAARLVAQVDERHMLFTSFRNDVLDPAFFLAVDPASNSLVLAVRGTLSLQDCVTDAFATPAPLLVEGVEGPCVAHSGIVRSCENILATIDREGLVEAVICGSHSDHRLVLVGHSLGAGCAAVLGIMLRNRHPQLRERLKVFAYAPPGGLLSRPLSEHTASFVTSTFMGKDLVPHLALHTLQRFRRSLFFGLAASQATKAGVFARWLGGRCVTTNRLVDRWPDTKEEVDRLQDLVADWDRPAESRRPPEDYGTGTAAPLFTPPHDAEPVEEEPPRMYPPARMVHFARVAAVRKCCAWPCGVPGRAGCFAELEYCPVWVSVDELQDIQCSPQMVADHMPDRLYHVLEHANAAMQAGDLDRYVDENAPRHPPPYSVLFWPTAREFTGLLDGADRV